MILLNGQHSCDDVVLVTSVYKLSDQGVLTMENQFGRSDFA